jgi:hypothetical protein
LQKLVSNFLSQIISGAAGSSDDDDDDDDDEDDFFGTLFDFLGGKYYILRIFSKIKS